MVGARVRDSGASTVLRVTVADALGEVAYTNPDRIALVSADRPITYCELNESVTKLAGVLRGRGVSGRPVAFMVPSGPDWVRCFFAVVAAGGVAVPLNPRLKARELGLILADIRPALLVAVPRVRGADVAAVLDEVRVTGAVRAGGVLPDVAYLSELDAATALADMPPASKDAGLAAVFYTTGTTGAPKGVMHTHAALLDSFDRMQELYAGFFGGSTTSTTDKIVKVATLVRRYGARLRHGIGAQAWLTPLPLHSIAGFRFALHALLGGHRLVVMDAFHPRTMLELVERERVNILAVTPSMLEVAVDLPGRERHNLSSLLVVGLGAAPTSPELVRRARAALRCAVVVGYGATETGGGVLVTRLDDGERQMSETVGTPFPGTEVKVVDEYRRDLPPGDVGELVCRSSGLMAGYHGATAATAAVVDEDGWYYTGDLASIDERGFVRIHGRKRDLIIRGGQNVVPAEVEAVLLEHPAVFRAAVVGVPDRVAGETIWAFVVPASPAGLDATELRGHCAGRLDPAKLPDNFQIVAELPVAESGEIRKVELRELAERQKASAVKEKRDG